MKVIFLDFNGVLDTWFVMDKINYDNLQRLKGIVRDTGAKVVLTTSNKRSFVTSGVMNPIMVMLTTRLMEEGIDVIGVTPNCDTREHEIMMYLHEHPEIENYVIIDDDYEMDSLREHLVKLPCQNIGREQIGLTKYYADMAIQILGKTPKEENDVKLALKKNNL